MSAVRSITIRAPARTLNRLEDLQKRTGLAMSVLLLWLIELGEANAPTAEDRQRLVEYR